VYNCLLLLLPSDNPRNILYNQVLTVSSKIEIKYPHMLTLCHPKRSPWTVISSPWRWR